MSSFFTIAVLLLCISAVVSSDQVIVEKSDLLDTLSVLAGRAEDNGGACDLLFLPDDDGRHSLLQNGELEEAWAQGKIMSPDISMQLVERSKCPLIVLNTSRPERFEKARAVASDTRFPVNVALLTENEMVLAAYRNASWRFTFDAHLVTSHDSEKLVIETLIPTENEAWKTVRVVYVPGDYWIQLKPDGNHVGNDWEVLKQLSVEVGTSYVFAKSPNSFVGMIDEVEAGRADMAISQGSFETGRFNRAGDMSASYYERIFFLLAYKPSEMPARWTLTNVFDIWGWFWLGSSILGMAVALKLLNAESYINHDSKINNYRVFAISVITLISEALPHEWFDFRLTSKMGMILMFTWFPCGLLISFAYKSALLASLVAVEYNDPINTWQELYDSNLIMSVPSYLIMHALFRDSQRDIVQKVYKQNVIEWGGLYHDSPEFNERIKPLRDAGKAMAIGTGLAGKKHLHTQGETLEYTYVGSHFVKKFPWRRQQDLIINRLVDTAILLKNRHDEDFKRDKAERDYVRYTHVEKEKPITLTHMWLTWIVMGVGTALSLVALAWEGVNWWIFGEKTGRKRPLEIGMWMKYEENKTNKK